MPVIVLDSTPWDYADKWESPGAVFFLSMGAPECVPSRWAVIISPDWLVGGRGVVIWSLSEAKTVLLIKYAWLLPEPFTFMCLQCF